MDSLARFLVVALLVGMLVDPAVWVTAGIGSVPLAGGF